MSLLGFPIGFYGYMFPGNINIMILDLYRSKRYAVLISVIALALIFESVYCIASLFYLNTVKSYAELFSMVEVFSFLMVLVMGLWMVMDKKSTKEKSQNNTLYRGVISIIIHPQQIPFWIAMGVFIYPVFNFGMDRFSVAAFVFANALGVLMMMVVYMVYGNKLMNYYKVKLNRLNVIIGVFYIMIAVFAIGKFLIK